jgi:hypothetical protein
VVLNKAGWPHGFRNDGVEPVLMSISVGTGMPKPPVYVCHPRDSDPSVARRFGAARGKTHAFDSNSDDPRQQECAQHICGMSLRAFSGCRSRGLRVCVPQSWGAFLR